MNSDDTIGIDFGTTKTLAACFRHGATAPAAIRLGEKGDPIQTLVHIDALGQTTCGDAAERNSRRDPEGCLRDFKRHLGSSHRTIVRGKPYTSRQLTTLFLSHVRECCLAGVSKQITNAVITVPVTFDIDMRGELKAAAIDAGFREIHIMEEPAAAARAYLSERCARNRADRILVVDWGGGTLDLALAEIAIGGDVTVHCSLRGGDSRLGGEDMDQRIHDWLRKQLGGAKPKNRHRFRTEVTEGKIRLTDGDSTEFDVETAERDYFVSCKRTEFNGLVKDLCEKAAELTWSLLSECRRQKLEPSRILLIGGTTRIPFVRDLLRKVVAPLPVESYDRDLVAVAYGAAAFIPVLPSRENPTQRLHAYDPDRTR